MRTAPATITHRGPVRRFAASDWFARLRLRPLVRRLVAVQAAVLVAVTVLAPTAGVSLVWETGLPNALLLALLLATWMWYAATAERRNRAHVPDVLLAIALLLLFTNIGGPGQYVGVALALPLVDPWLAAADAALGIHVPTLAEWTAGVPWLATALRLAYSTLLPQFIVPPIVLGLVYRDRAAMWEFVFHFHVCLVATLAGGMFLPAACPFVFYGDFPQIFEHARFIQHFEALRSGAGFAVRYDDIDGLISIPSFHTAGGLMVTWAFRRYHAWLVPCAVLNALLIAATVLSGTHYGVDVLVTVAVFVGSIVLWRRWGRIGLDDAATSPARS